MRSLIVASAFLLAATGIARADVEVGKVAKVFSGPEGMEITVVPVQQKDPKAQKQALVKYTGVDGEWEGQVLLVDVMDLGDKGVDYKLRYKNSDWVTIVGRSSYGGALRYEVYYPGTKHDGTAISYDDVKSKAAKPSDVLSEYKKGQKKK